jgi:hypothetical protein
MKMASGTAAPARSGAAFAQVAEADGNRTRRRRSAPSTSFEDRGDHQVPKRLRVDSTAAALRRQAMQVPGEQRDLPAVLGLVSRQAHLTRALKRIILAANLGAARRSFRPTARSCSPASPSPTAACRPTPPCGCRPKLFFSKRHYPRGHAEGKGAA